MKEIQFSIRYDDYDFIVVNNKIYVEYEDIMNRRYWHNLSTEDGWEDDAYIFFDYLWRNFKNEKIPQYFWISWYYEIKSQAENDLDTFYYRLKNNDIQGLNETLSISSKDQLIYLKDLVSDKLTVRDQLKSNDCKTHFYRKILNLINIVILQK